MRPARLVNTAQLVRWPLLNGAESDTSIAQTLVTATSTTVAAALGFSRQQRRAFFIQLCVFKHIRRYMLLLAVSR